MKKLLVGLLVLGSFSSFASKCEVVCEQTDGASFGRELLTGLEDALNRNLYLASVTRTCSVIHNNDDVFYSSKISGRVIVGMEEYRQLSGRKLRYYKKHGKFMPTKYEKRITKQDEIININLVDCEKH
jgi:hypothetical protein